MRRFWQKPPVVSMDGNLSDPAVGNTPVKAAKNSLQGTIASNQTKKQPQTECLFKAPILFGISDSGVVSYLPLTQGYP